MAARGGGAGVVFVSAWTASGLQITNNRTTCHSAISGIYGGSLSGPFSRVKQSRKNTVWSLKMGPVGCPGTSTTTYQPTLPNFPEEHDLNYTVAEAKYLFHGDSE